MKTIFHIDSTYAFETLIGNVKNLSKLYNDNNFDIIILANSKAVKGLVKLEVVNEIKALSSSNITFKACNNALNKYMINPSDLNELIKVVSAGVYELTLKQTEGYAYIKVS